MANLFKNRLFLGAVCIILAAVIAFVALPRFYASRSGTTGAVKLTQDIPAGTVVTEAMLSTVEAGSFGLPDSVVLDQNEAVGKVAAENLYAGEYLTDTRLIAEEEYGELVEERIRGLEAGYCLVSLKFPTASAGVASVLRSGHIVDVHECVENEDGSITVLNALPSMYVYDVLNADLESLSSLDEKLEKAVVEDDTDYDFEPAFVVFRCTGEQAQTLIRLERMGSLHLTLQRTGG